MKRDGQKSKSEAEKRLEQKGWIWVVLIAIDAGKATDHRELDCVKGDYALTMGLALSMNFTFLAFLGVSEMIVEVVEKYGTSAGESRKRERERDPV
ncbi:hypothetical protein RUM44_007852 [Polyplax serrata]|uniref:Uncharacterized protein n=1 Tax=Polyplax serrata TaxID=468196 RepID=A0ABR1BB30_POLSC